MKEAFKEGKRKELSQFSEETEKHQKAILAEWPLKWEDGLSA